MVMPTNASDPESKRRKKDKLQDKRVLYKAKYESVKQWSIGVENDFSGSSKTEEGHLNSLIKFCEHIGMNPDEIITARIQDSLSNDPRVRNRFELLLKGFVVKIKKESLSVAHHVATSIKSFFFYNLVPLTYKAPSIGEQNTSCPSKEALEKLYQGTDPGLRARISFIRQSGARRGTVVKTKYKHIKPDFEAGIIPLHIHYEKEEVKGKKFGYDTFLGKQAVEDIRINLEKRKRGTRKIPPEEITDESPIFIKENIATVEALDETGLSQWYVDQSKKVGFKKDEIVMPHAVRRSTQTTMEKANLIQLNWIDHLMGHRPRGAQGKHYSKPTVEELREAYAKVESFLTLSLTPLGEASIGPTSAVDALNRTSSVAAGQMPNAETMETKPIDRLTEQEINELHKKNQQVQQSLSNYMKTPFSPTSPTKIENSLANDCKQDKTPVSEDNSKPTELPDSSKVEIGSSMKEQESISCEIVAAKTNDEKLKLFKEGWGYLKEVPNGTFLLWRIKSKTV